jgi:hypothetical protein
VQAENAAQQNRLAGTGTANDAQDLVAPDVEFKPVVHDLTAETVDQAANGDHMFMLLRHQNPILA